MSICLDEAEQTATPREDTLNDDDIYLAKKAFTDWIFTVMKEGKWEERYGAAFPDINTLMNIFVAHIEHSALLSRLLSGKEAFPFPPPRAFSYPWYDLLELGTAICMEVHSINEVEGTLVIEQMPWYIKRILGPREYLVGYDARAPLFRLSFVDSLQKWKLDRMLRWP